MCIRDSHQTMPKDAYTYALPYEYYEKHKVRRYGFHGTSHRYVSQRAAEMLGKPIEELKLISCHMGNGSSLCAVDGGKSVDTSMGFTPNAGLPMGTRCGDIDIGIPEFIMDKESPVSYTHLDVYKRQASIYVTGNTAIDALKTTVRDDFSHPDLCLLYTSYAQIPNPALQRHNEFSADYRSKIWQLLHHPNMCSTS